MAACAQVGKGVVGAAVYGKWQRAAAGKGSNGGGGRLVQVALAIVNGGKLLRVIETGGAAEDGNSTRSISGFHAVERCIICCL